MISAAPACDFLEKYQVWLYLACILAGLLIGLQFPGITSRVEPAVWPLLGLLLYATFTQVPLIHLSRGLRDFRFLAALLLGNFVVIPLVVGGLVSLLPVAMVVKVGVLLVLLVPCTDWFISFTHLGGGDAGRATVASPLLLIGQLIMAPLYLWLFLGSDWMSAALSGHLLAAFFGLIALPLLLAWLTEKARESSPVLQKASHCLGYLPVPLLALVVFAIAASQVGTVAGMTGPILQVLLIFVGYLVGAAVLGKWLSRWLCLSTPAARTLTFSFGTRNSFVMLPVALALPEPWRAAVVIVVFQSLVELFGMLVFLRWVPRHVHSSGVRQQRGGQV